MLSRLTGRITGPLAITILLIIVSEDNVENIKNIERVEGEGGHQLIMKAITSKHSEDGYYIFTNNSDVILWIDVPSSFPWRSAYMSTWGSCSPTSASSPATSRSSQ